MKPLMYDISKVRSVLLEVPVSGAAGTGSFPLPTNANLRDAEAVLSVEAFNASLVSKSYSGAINAPDNCYKTASLTIVDSGSTTVREKMPLAKMIRSNGTAAIRDINLFRKDGGPNPIDPEKSQVTIGDLSTLGAGTVILLEFTYLVK